MSKIKIHLKQHAQTSMQLENDVLKIIIDRPVAKGGGGEGLMGGQYMLTGIGGCFCSNLFAAAQARDVEIKGLTIDMTATLSDDLPKRFTDLDMEVSYESCSDESMFEKLMVIAEKGCLSMNTVKNSMAIQVKHAQKQA